jgi:hypothetical protein
MENRLLLENCLLLDQLLVLLLEQIAEGRTAEGRTAEGGTALPWLCRNGVGVA